MLLYWYTSLILFFVLSYFLFFDSSSRTIKELSSVTAQNQNQNQNCFLVTRQNDNHSPGPGTGPGRLDPSSHQRSELSNIILGISSGDKRVWKCIPIPNGLGEKATLINISVSNGDLICHRMIIPAAPDQGDKVICWYTGFALQTFVI